MEMKTVVYVHRKQEGMYASCLFPPLILKSTSTECVIKEMTVSNTSTFGDPKHQNSNFPSSSVALKSYKLRRKSQTAC